MREPLIPRQGDEVKASTIADIITWVRSIVPRGDGKTVRVKTTNGGSTITSFGGSGTSMVPVLVGSHLIYDQTAQKMVYLGNYCPDFDGVMCTTWNPCYLVPLNNILIEEYDPDNPEIYDFPANTILFGQLATYDLGYTPVYPLYCFDYPRWL